MTDTIQIEENTPEHVAYRLLRDIANMEKRTILPHMVGRDGAVLAERAWYLDTYAECLRAATGGRPFGAPASRQIAT